MPPKKRSAGDADLPLNERARRALTTLVTGLSATLALLESIDDDQMLPVADELIDGAVGMLERASAIVRPERFSRIRYEWSPDDALRHVMKYACGSRRRMCTFGAGGVVQEESENPYDCAEFGRRTKLATIRLVCKDWARLGGQLVHVLAPPSRSRVNIGEIIAAFPNACRMNLRTLPAKKCADVEQLVRQYVEKRAPAEFFVHYTGYNDSLPIKLSGAVVNAACDGHGDFLAKVAAKYPFCVLPPDATRRDPISFVCPCTSTTFHAALTAGYQLRVRETIAPCVLALPDVVAPKFNVPLVEMEMGSLAPLLDTCPALFDQVHWEASRLPIFQINIFSWLDARQPVRALVERVGAEHVRLADFKKKLWTVDQVFSLYSAD